MREDGNRLSYTIRGTTVTITSSLVVFYRSYLRTRWDLNKFGCGSKEDDRDKS